MTRKISPVTVKPGLSNRLRRIGAKLSKKSRRKEKGTEITENGWVKKNPLQREGGAHCGMMSQRNLTAIMTTKKLSCLDISEMIIMEAEEDRVALYSMTMMMTNPACMRQDLIERKGEGLKS